MEVLHLDEVGKQKEQDHEKSQVEREQAFNEQTKELQQSIAALKSEQKAEEQTLKLTESRKRQSEEKAANASRKATDAEMREQKAIRHIDGLKGLGAHLRAFWDGLKESAMRKKLEAEVNSQISVSKKVAADSFALANQRKAEIDQMQRQAEEDKLSQETKFKNERIKLVREANSIIADQNQHIETLGNILTPAQKRKLERNQTRSNNREIER